MGRCTPILKIEFNMNIDLIMSDKSTGEVLWSTSRQLACNFVHNDAGRKLISRMIDSAIKGCRVSEHKYINCSIDLLETSRGVEQDLPFPIPESQKKEIY